jgi:5S rRNA maturation endonuclease (ribonuclease M5)
VKGSNTSTISGFIEEIIRKDKHVIVEGKRDSARLKKLGVQKVISLSRMQLCAFGEKICQSHDEVILLMDNDKEGKKLYSKLNKILADLGVKTNPKFQKMLASLKISHVEGLKTKIEE